MSVGSMVINNPNNLRFSATVVELFGVNPALNPITIIKQLNSPATYFIYCDLIEKRRNLLNGKPSTVLARTAQQHVLRDTSTGDYDVNGITITVKDEKGNLFDFNDMPLEFKLEIN